MIRIDKNYILDGISEKLIISCIHKHISNCNRFSRNLDYYKGDHKINNRKKDMNEPNNKIVCNYAKYITDTISGYFSGNPVTITSENEKDIDIILNALKMADVSTHDCEMEKQLSVYGVAYELVYVDDKTRIKLTILDPIKTFIVYDTSVENNSLFAVNYTICNNEIGKQIGFNVNIYTDEEIISYFSKDLSSLEFIESSAHFFSKVPITEFWNNDEKAGDFEGVIPLIDAYNTLMSDRINDKEKFVNAILIIAGASLPDDDDSIRKFKQDKMLNLPDSADVKYISATLNEAEVQILANAIKEDIHRFSQTPDFTDEKFSGNSSGIALKFKLESLENLAKVKERFFKAGIRRRLKLFTSILMLKGNNFIFVDDVKISMNRTLPVNQLEVAKMISMLKGRVSTETLLAQLPFVDNVEAELVKVANENEKEERKMLELYSNTTFNNLGG